MPTYAVGSKTGLAYAVETVFGTPPSPALMKGIRAKFGSKFELKRDTFSSKEVSATRQVMGMTYGNRSGSGNLPIEFSAGSFDDFMEAVTGGTWATNILKIGNANRSFTIEDQTSEIGVYEQNTGVVFTGFSLGVKPNAIVEGSFDFLFKDQRAVQSVLGATTLAMTATTATRSAGSFATDGFVAGDTVVFGGVLAPLTNTGPFILTNVAALVLTFTAGTAVVQAATANCTASIGPLSSGTGGSLTAASTTAPFDSFTGSITEGGTVIAYVTGLDLKLAVASQANNVVFQPTAQSITMGQAVVTGTLTAYFLNQALKLKFINGTATSLQFVLGTGSGSYTFSMAQVKYTSHTRDDQENAIIENIGFSALYDATDSTLKITRVP